MKRGKIKRDRAKLSTRHLPIKAGLVRGAGGVEDGLWHTGSRQGQWHCGRCRRRTVAQKTVPMFCHFGKSDLE